MVKNNLLFSKIHIAILNPIFIDKKNQSTLDMTLNTTLNMTLNMTLGMALDMALDIST